MIFFCFVFLHFVSWAENGEEDVERRGATRRDETVVVVVLSCGRVEVKVPGVEVEKRKRKRRGNNGN